MKIYCQLEVIDFWHLSFTRKYSSIFWECSDL